MAARWSAAVAVAIVVTVVADQVVYWVVPPLTRRGYLVAQPLVAVSVLAATRGRVALPQPDDRWPRRPWYGGLVRACAWFTAIALSGALLIGVTRHWWPNVERPAVERIWAPYSRLVRAPIWEEVVWRGVVLGVALRLTAPHAAIAISTIAFVVTHWDQGYRAPGLISVTVLGITVAIAAWRTGTLWLPIAFHAIFNVTGAGPAVLGGIGSVWLAVAWFRASTRDEVFAAIR